MSNACLGVLRGGYDGGQPRLVHGVAVPGCGNLGCAGCFCQLVHFDVFHRGREPADPAGVALCQHLIPQVLKQPPSRVGKPVIVLCACNFGLILVGDLAGKQGDQGVLHQFQLDLLVLRHLHQREIQSRQRGNGVPGYIVCLKGKNLVHRQRHPVEPPPVLGVYLRVSRQAASGLLPPLFQHVQVHPVPRREDHPLPRSLRCPLRRCVEVIQIGQQQVSELQGVRPRLHKVHQVHRHRVFGNVVEPYDLYPVAGELL